MKRIMLVVFLIAIMATYAGATGRIYNGLNAGIAWDWGGYEWQGTPGLFVCSAGWNQFPYAANSSFAWLRPFFSTLPIADC